MTTPMPYSGRAAASTPASSMAQAAAVMARRVMWSVCGISRLGMCSSATKPGTSPASVAGYCEASKRVTGPMPERPSRVAFQ